MTDQVTNPTPLSPAANAVLDAVEPCVAPNECPGLEAAIAAALRAAALHIDDGSDGLESQDILRQIAAELEGAQ